MNKTKLQQEILEKIKQGVKPSILKKSKNSNGEKVLGQFNPLIFPSHQENNTPASSPPASPLIVPVDKKRAIIHPKSPTKNLDKSKLKQLQEQVNFHANAANTYLASLQTTMAQLDQAEEKIKELETKPNQLSQEIATALKEANQKIREQEKTIKDLQNQAKTPAKDKETKLPTFTCSDCQQNKTHQELSRQFANFSFCRACSKKARAIAQEQKPEPQPQSFTCASCEQTQPGTPSKMKLDKSLQEYPICHQCRPNLKEFNEADLITDELWAKYPYSSASEILEKEFGIQKEEPW